MKVLHRRMRYVDRRTVQPRPKEAAAVYGTPEHKIWSTAVKKRDGWKCVVCGDRTSRLYADHVIEIEDGGSATDVRNGQTLCAVHHAEKTARERARRASESGMSNQ
jgi:5-methylcytosine-specific restriction protein A